MTFKDLQYSDEYALRSENDRAIRQAAARFENRKRTHPREFARRAVLERVKRQNTDFSRLNY
jgi:hypothetical protein